VESLLNLGYKVVSTRWLSHVASDIGTLFYAENGLVFGDTFHISKEKIVPELRRFLTSDTKIKSIQLMDAESDLLLELYEPREFPDLLPDRLHSPVGLSIGAEGPEEISVSIMAELLKIRNTE
jgi:hypothetical protein